MTWVIKLVAQSLDWWASSSKSMNFNEPWWVASSILHMIQHFMRWLIESQPTQHMMNSFSKIYTTCEIDEWNHQSEATTHKSADPSDESEQKNLRIGEISHQSEAASASIGGYCHQPAAWWCYLQTTRIFMSHLTRFKKHIAFWWILSSNLR